MLTEADFEEIVFRCNDERDRDHLIAHNREQLAEIERLRGDVRVARAETKAERELYEQMHDIAIQHRRDSDKWAAEAAGQRAEIERLRAALARYPTSAADAIICKLETAHTNADWLAPMAAIRAIVEEDGQ